MTIKQITTFSTEVYQAVKVLIPQLGDDLVLPTEEEFKNILNSEGAHFFIAQIDEKIVGMLSIGSYLILTGRKMWIEDVVVSQTVRGQGIGKALILHAIAYARQAGVQAIMLTSRPQRAAANSLYQSLGFIKRETNVYIYNL